jgi:MFS transporter, AAHS family, 4-hydroxybenzoate transporter
MPPTESNITALIDQQKMTAVQYATILICFLMNMLDGMDVLVIAFTAPAISEEWGVSPQALGVVFRE